MITNVIYSMKWKYNGNKMKYINKMKCSYIEMYSQMKKQCRKRKKQKKKREKKI